jgi:hypothetical protein
MHKPHSAKMTACTNGYICGARRFHQLMSQSVCLLRCRPNGRRRPGWPLDHRVLDRSIKVRRAHARTWRQAHSPYTHAQAWPGATCIHSPLRASCAHAGAEARWLATDGAARGGRVVAAQRVARRRAAARYGPGGSTGGSAAGGVCGTGGAACVGATDDGVTGTRRRPAPPATVTESVRACRRSSQPLSISLRFSPHPRRTCWCRRRRAPVGCASGADMTA